MKPTAFQFPADERHPQNHLMIFPIPHPGNFGCYSDSGVGLLVNSDRQFTIYVKGEIPGEGDDAITVNIEQTRELAQMLRQFMDEHFPADS